MAGNGLTLPREQAEPILNAAGVSADTVLSPEGLDFVYQGQQYFILQRETFFPSSSFSPDGWHVVYLPTDAEVAEHDYYIAQQQPDADPFGLGDISKTIGDVLQYLIIGGAVIAGLYLLQFMPKGDKK